MGSLLPIINNLYTYFHHYSLLLGFFYLHRNMIIHFVCVCVCLCVSSCAHDYVCEIHHFLCYKNTVDPWTTQVWTAWVHLYVDFFQQIHSTVLHDPGLVESMDVELQIPRADYKVLCTFLTVQKVSIPNPHVVKVKLYSTEY